MRKMRICEKWEYKKNENMRKMRIWEKWEY